jgi:hypothetical protein
MEGPISYTAVLDASVLVPGFLSNFLLWLAEVGLYRAKWSEDIHAEWIRGRHKRYNISVEMSMVRRQTIDREFPHGLVTDYQNLIEGLALPDSPCFSSCHQMWCQRNNYKQSQALSASCARTVQYCTGAPRRFLKPTCKLGGRHLKRG